MEKILHERIAHVPVFYDQSPHFKLTIIVYLSVSFLFLLTDKL